jgi:hypothetical protein
LRPTSRTTRIESAAADRAVAALRQFLIERVLVTTGPSL